MNFLKRCGKFVFGSFFISVVIYLLVGDNSSLDSTGKAVEVSQYFKYIDAWNVIFALLYGGTTLGLFLLFLFGLDRIFKIISNRFPKLNFLNAAWADYVFQIPFAFFLVVLVFLVGSNAYVAVRANKSKIVSIDTLTAKPVVLLGTSKMLSSGRGINLYYTYRIEAAIELWRAGKVLFFILSGDGLGEAHKKGTYSETNDMRNDLLAAGIPEDKIKIDSLGLRTVDSSLRLISVFNVNDVIFISQDFHTARAVVQSELYGIHALAYDAKGSATLSMWKKELLVSRPALIVDVFFANVQPRVTGTDSEVVKTHEDFKVTSNRHVMILLGLGALVVFGIGGIFAYRASSGQERTKVVIRYSAITFSLTVVISILAVQVYKRVEFKLLTEIVETVAQSVGVQTHKMAVKQEERLTSVHGQKEEKISVPKESVKDSLAVVGDQVEKKPVENVKVEFNTAVADVKTESAVQLVAEKKEEDPFNSSIGESSDDFNTSDFAEAKDRKFFKAKVHNTQTLVNDGTISLRLLEQVTIGGKIYPVNYVFDGRTALFNGRFIIVPAFAEGIKNYDGGKEGNKLEARHQSKKGEVILSEGEQITFGY